MSNEDHIIQTNSAGRKKGGRKVASPGIIGGAAADVSKVDQALTAGEIVRGAAHALAPVPFDYQGEAVRTVVKDDQVWFVAADICAVLEITNPRDALSRLDEDEKGVGITHTLGGPQQLNIVSESGLYILIFTSRKPKAKAFRRWVTGVVLPTLRRTGRFDISGQSDPATTPKPKAENVNDQVVTVALPGPGRYLVGLLPNGDQRIEQLCFSDAISAVAALDCRSIAYSYLTVAALWEKLQHLHTMPIDVSRGLTFEKLSTSMKAGTDLARQILYGLDEPRLIYRRALGEAAE